MPTFGDWELTVLDHAYEEVDYISMHQYYVLENDNTADFLARTVHMDAFIKSVAALCDAVKAKKHSNKTVNLSFDEWNVWYHATAHTPGWEIAPSIIDDIYTFEDALLVGCMMITLQNNCDRVKMACLAQLVNVIAPIMTETGGAAWAQTIFYPFMYGSVYGRGTTMQRIVNCDSYKTTDGLEAKYIDCSVVNNKEKRELVVYAVNRSLDEEMELDLKLEGFENAKLIEHIELYCDDLKAINDKDNTPVNPTNREIGKMITLNKHSWNMLRFEY